MTVLPGGGTLAKENGDFTVWNLERTLKSELQLKLLRRQNFLFPTPHERCTRMPYLLGLGVHGRPPV